MLNSALKYFVCLAFLTLEGCRSVGGGQYVGRNEFDTLTHRVVEVEARVGLSPWGGGLPALVSAPPAEEVRPSAPAPAVQTPAPGLMPPPGYKPGGSWSTGEKAVYQEGQRLLKARQYARAADIFSRLLAENPAAGLAPNARYWLGECFYAQGHFSEAATEFRRCADEYPQTDKAADALLKLSFCYDRLGDGPRAMAALDQLLGRYPRSNAALMVKSGRGNFQS
jgi:tol-pal system protein YbgF